MGNFSIGECRDAFYAGFIENLFYNYMTLFLMYLIIKFSADKLVEERQDPCLGRNVPVIVYIQNQKLIKDAVKNELTMNAQKKKAIIAQAQRNEYMYAILKENGIAVRTDEQIGIEFFEMGEIDRSNKFGRLSNYPTKSLESAHSSVQRETFYENEDDEEQLDETGE